MTAAATVLPEFALLALGVVLRRWAWRSPDFWVELERLVYLVLFPALLLRTTLTADLAAAGVAALLLTSLGATLAGALLGAAVRWFPGADAVTAASGWQTAFRFNTYLALGLVDDAGPASLALLGVLLGVNVPVVNVLAVTALARGTAGSARGTALGAVLRNPLILATVGGLIGNAAGLRLPEPADAVLARLGVAAVPLGLLAVGAALRLRGLGRDQWLMVGHLTAVKLLAVPAVGLALAAAADLTGEQRAVLLAFTAVPPATASYVLTARMGGNAPFVAATTTVATGVALVTLPLWLAVSG